MFMENYVILQARRTARQQATENPNFITPCVDIPRILMSHASRHSIGGWRKVLLHNGDRTSSRSSVESSCNACRVVTAGGAEMSKEKLLAFGLLKLSSRSMQLFLKSFKVVLLF